MCERAATVVVETVHRIGYEGFITIMLAILGLMMGLAAVVAALFAVFGYETLKREVIAQAREAAKQVSLNELVAKAEAVAKETASAVAKASFEEAAKSSRDLTIGVQLAAAQPDPTPTASNEAEPISANYPGEEASNGDGDTNIDPRAGDPPTSAE